MKVIELTVCGPYAFIQKNAVEDLTITFTSTFFFTCLPTVEINYHFFKQLVSKINNNEKLRRKISSKIHAP